MNRLAILCFILAFLSGILALLPGCREESYAIPEIWMDQPAAYATFTVPDTIRVEARVLSDDPLTALKVTLVDVDYAPVSPAFNISLIQPHDAACTWFIRQDIPIDAISIESGIYFIWIYAATEHESKNKYLEISIKGVEKKMQRILLFLKTNPASTSLVSVDSLWQTEDLFVFPSDVGQVCADHAGRRMYLAGSATSRLFAWNLDSNRIEWERSGSGTPGIPYYQGLTVDGGLLFAATGSGRLAGYRPDGSTAYFQDLGFEDYPVRTCLAGNRLVVAVRKRAGEKNYLNNYIYPGGAFVSGREVAFAVRSMLRLEEETILAAGNEDGKGLLRYWHLSLPALNTPCSFPQEEITGMVRMNDKHYLLSTPGGVYWYQPETTTLTAFVTGVPVTWLDADMTTDRVFVTTHDQLRVYAFPQGVLLQSVVAGDSVRACLAVYNK